jgi:hypothetical protein
MAGIITTQRRNRLLLKQVHLGRQTDIPNMFANYPFSLTKNRIIVIINN